MRCIRFRGKKYSNGDWVEGLPYNIFTNTFVEGIEDDIGNRHAILIETVGQFTGLYDKHGEMIYENDIIACHKSDTMFVGVVNYGTGGFCVKEIGHGKNNPAIDIIMNENTVVIIGNVYDNPEILEV